MFDIELKINEFIYSYREINRKDDDFEWERINAPEDFIYAVACYGLSCWHEPKYEGVEERTLCLGDFHEQVSVLLDSGIWERRKKFGDTESCRLRIYREPKNLDVLNGKEQYAKIYWQIESDKELYHFFHIYMRCLYYYLAFPASSDPKKVEEELEKILTGENINQLCIEISTAIKGWNEEELSKCIRALDELKKVCSFIKNHYMEDKHSFRFSD